MSTYRILLIDDQPLVLSALARYLEQQGYEVHTRGNGKEGVEAAEELRPDVVITDVLMPVMDGWAVLKHLRAKPEFALTPLVVLTDLDSSEHRIQGFTTGADDFVSKNTIVEELEARISRAVERSLALRQAVGIDHEPAKSAPDATVDSSEQDGDKSASVSDHWNLPSFSDAAASVAPPVEEDDDDRDGESGMRGNVDQIGLASILTLLSGGDKTGVLTLTRADGRSVGNIYLRDGVILQAQIDDEDDADQMGCFCKIMGWAGASFSFSRQKVTVEDKLKIPTEHLLMEASRILDEG